MLNVYKFGIKLIILFILLKLDVNKCKIYDIIINRKYFYILGRLVWWKLCNVKNIF